MISEVLKTQTAPLHQALEDKLYVRQIMDGSISVAQYNTIILVNYWVHERAEPAIAAALGLNGPGVGINERLKMPALKQDVDFLQMAAANHLPAIVFLSEAEALGAMYVLEGATLGGKFILKKLLQKSTLKDYPHHYYHVYGDNTGALWKNFLAFINEQVTTPEAQGDCVTGAEKMYHYFLAAVDKTIL